MNHSQDLYNEDVQPVQTLGLSSNQSKQCTISIRRWNPHPTLRFLVTFWKWIREYCKLSKVWYYTKVYCNPLAMGKSTQFILEQWPYVWSRKVWPFLSHCGLFQFFFLKIQDYCHAFHMSFKIWSLDRTYLHCFFSSLSLDCAENLASHPLLLRRCDHNFALDWHLIVQVRFMSSLSTCGNKD